MAKPAFSVLYRNLMHFVYQLKNIGLQCPKLCSPNQSSSSTWPGKLHQEYIGFEDTIQSMCFHPPCTCSSWDLITRFDHSQVKAWPGTPITYLTVLKAHTEGRTQANVDLSFSGAAEGRPSVSPRCLFQSWGKKLQTMNAAERGTSVSLPAHYPEPIFTHCYS